MARKIFIATFYSIIAFCVISYLTVMAAVLSSAGTSNKPVTNIGFPFKYYYQFWLNGTNSPNHGWDLGNFLLDCLITWVITLAIYFMVKKRNL